MTFTIDAADPRSIKAIQIAATASSWARISTRSGHIGYGIPSTCQPGRLYLVDDGSCDCPDAKRRPGCACKHVLAVRLYCELRKAQQPSPAPRPRGTVLQMVRHGDGDVTWDRAADVARAARYDEIFGNEGA